jgi:hypothetical protein
MNMKYSSEEKWDEMVNYFLHGAVGAVDGKRTNINTQEER